MGNPEQKMSKNRIKQELIVYPSNIIENVTRNINHVLIPQHESDPIFISKGISLDVLVLIQNQFAKEVIPYSAK